MKKEILIIASLILASCSNNNKVHEILLNQNDLEGWETTCIECWSVKDGVLTGRNSIDKVEDVLYTKKKDYCNFLLDLDFKMGVGKRVDSGIFLKSYNEQIQIGYSLSMKKDMTGFVYLDKPLHGYPVANEFSTSSLKRNDWNNLKIEVINNRYTIWLNGMEIMSYKSTTGVHNGAIGLQMHQNRTMEIKYKNIKVTEL